MSLEPFEFRCELVEAGAVAVPTERMSATAAIDFKPAGDVIPLPGARGMLGCYCWTLGIASSKKDTFMTLFVGEWSPARESFIDEANSRCSPPSR